MYHNKFFSRFTLFVFWLTHVTLIIYISPKRKKIFRRYVFIAQYLKNVIESTRAVNIHVDIVWIIICFCVVLCFENFVRERHFCNDTRPEVYTIFYFRKGKRSPSSPCFTWPSTVEVCCPYSSHLYWEVSNTKSMVLTCYRLQTKFAKVMFLQVSVYPQGGGMRGRGACMTGGHAWQGGCAYGRGDVHGRVVCGRGSMHGRGMGRSVHGRGVCGRRCMAGGMHGGGACMVGGMHGRECAWWVACMPCMLHIPPADATRYGDAINERAVRILLECILVWNNV